MNYNFSVLLRDVYIFNYVINYYKLFYIILSFNVLCVYLIFVEVTTFNNNVKY